MAGPRGAVLGPAEGAERVLSRGALAGIVAVVAVAVYANSLGNGFALDDGLLIRDNAAVHRMDVETLVGGPWWPRDAGGQGLYRPLSALSASVQWQLFGGAPAGFHAASVAGHALVSVLVFFLLLSLASLAGALVGGFLFALHPVHTEAVANLVGQAEILAGGLVLLACLLYVRLPDRTPGQRMIRAPAIGLLYFLALSAKEIAVTLPALLPVLAWLQHRTSSGPVSDPAVEGGPEARPVVARIRRELPLYLLLPAVLGLHLVFRMQALGSAVGVGPAPSLRGLDTGERILTSVSLWPEYARLLLGPFDLVSDYGPAVLFPARELTLEVVAGAVLAVLAGILALVVRRRLPHAGAGLLWVAVALLPVSHLLFPVGTLLGERTLYLPSVGVSVVAAGATGLAVAAPGAVRKTALVLAVVAAVAFGVRVVTRNPAWESDEALLRTLAREHPESYRVVWLRARGAAARGDPELAGQAYEVALGMNPMHRSLLVEAGAFYGRTGEWGRAEPLLRRAVELAPWRPEPWGHLAEQLLRRGRFREAHRTALRGLARAGPDRLLWSLVSEAYLARGDLDAAARARRAALAAEPSSAGDWLRLLQIMHEGRRWEGGAPR